MQDVIAEVLMDLGIKRIIVRFFSICCLIVFACSNREPTKVVIIEIAPNKLSANKELVEMKDLERKLLLVIDEQKKAGIKLEDVSVDLTVDPRTKRGDVADLEVILRKVNLRRITFRQAEQQ